MMTTFINYKKMFSIRTIALSLGMLTLVSVIAIHWAEASLLTTNLNLSDGTTVGSVMISDDGQTVVYSENNVTFDSPIYRSAVYRKDGPHLVTDSGILVPRTHSGPYVLYTEMVDGQRKLFALSTATGVSLLVTPKNVDVTRDEWHFYSERAQISPDNRYIVYFGNDRSTNVLSLYRAEIDGDTVLSIEQLPGITYYPIAEFSYLKISPDSRLVMVYTQGADSQSDVFVLPINGDGGAPQTLYPEPGSNTRHSNVRMAYTPDSQYAIIQSTNVLTGQKELARINLSDGSRQILAEGKLRPHRARLS